MRSAPLREATPVRLALIALALLLLGLFLLAPLVVVFGEAFKAGIDAYFAALGDEDTLSSIRLTLAVAVCTVPINLLVGVAAAWCVAKFDFPGKTLLTTLIDLPFSVSPVIAGLVYVLMFGLQGWLGPYLHAHHIKVIFALPGILLATLFVTFPLSPAN